MRFRKKPVVIEAVQWTGSNVQAIAEFVAGKTLVLADRRDPEVKIQCANTVARFDFTAKPPRLVIPTLEGDHTALAGDWIIRGIKGEFYPCKPDIFTATYEPVSEQL